MTIIETKQGYQKTKLGWIPLDWEVKELGSLGVFLKGKGITKKELVEEGKACIRYGEIYTKHHYFIKDFYSFINESTAESSVRIYKNDLLFTGSGETLADIGKCVAFIDNKEAYAGGDIIIFREHSQDTKFLGFLFNQYIVNRQTFKLGQGNAVVHIYSKGIKQLKIPLPPLAEQKKIAKILSIWGTAISKTKALIEKKQILKKGLMQVLLTGKVRFGEFVGEEGTKKSKLGLIPKDWEVRKSGTVLRYLGGAAFKSKDSVSVGVKWLKIANVGIAKVKWDVNSFLPYSYRDKYAQYVLGEDDIVLALTRPIINNKLKIARLTRSDAPALLNQRVAKLESKKGIDILFAYQFMQLPYFIHSMNGSMAGTDPPNIGFNGLNNILIPLPPLPEQKKIAKVLSTCDEAIEKLNQELAQLEAQKKGLMQQLLTGAKRVEAEA